MASGPNVGFGVAHNAVAAAARGIYFVALNNDLVIDDPRWLEKIRAAFLADPRLGAVGAAGGCDSLGADGLGCVSSDYRPPEYVEGSCLAMPTWLARRFGPFDPAYRFAYCEDADREVAQHRQKFSVIPAAVP